MKRKVALISTGFAPIPDVCGGAIEHLVTEIIEQNEDIGIYSFDVYTILNNKLDTVHFKNTKIIQVKKTHNFLTVLIKIYNRICKHLRIKSSIGPNDVALSNSVICSSYDIIIVENNMNIFRMLSKKNKEKRAMFFHLHNSILNDYSKNETLTKYVCQNSSAIFCVSKYIQQQILDLRIGNPVLFYNCVDRSLFKPLTKELIASLKKEYGIPTNKRVLLYCGRLSPEKGLDLLIDALIKLWNERKDFLLLIIGKSWFNSHLENNYIKDIRTKTRDASWIIFSGYIDNKEMYKFYNISDLTIIPSRVDEAFGMVAIESIVCGTPVIASNKGGLPEIVDNNVGYLVDVSNDASEHIKSAIEETLYNDFVYAQKVEKCLEVSSSKQFDSRDYFCNFDKLINDNC